MFIFLNDRHGYGCDEETLWCCSEISPVVEHSQISSVVECSQISSVVEETILKR